MSKKILYMLYNCNCVRCDFPVKPRDRNVSQCPCSSSTYLTFSFMSHVDGRCAQTAHRERRHCHTCTVSELMACSPCGPMPVELLSHTTAGKRDCGGKVCEHTFKAVLPLIHMHKHLLRTRSCRCLFLFGHGQKITL